MKTRRINLSGKAAVIVVRVEGILSQGVASQLRDQFSAFMDLGFPVAIVDDTVKNIEVYEKEVKAIEPSEYIQPIKGLDFSPGPGGWSASPGETTPEA